MPSPPKRSDIVLGDRYGDSASGELMAIAQSALASLNFDVARNAPYAGGYTTALYGRPRAGVHALQIEINRDLYWDDAAMEKNPAFDTLRNRLYFFAERLLAQSSAVLPPQDRLRAAE